MEKATAYKREVLNSVKFDVAHKNQALAFRLGVSTKMTLPCATFMDDKPGEYLNSIDHCGVDEKRFLGRSADAVKLELLRERQVRLQIGPYKPDDVSDSATMAEFTKHFEKRKKKAVLAERRKATWLERVREAKQRLREKYINYDYE